MENKQNEALKDELSYSNLYKNSRMRTNLLAWYPFKKEQNVLLVSEQCDVVESYLREKVHSVEVWMHDLVEDEKKYDVLVQIGVLDCNGHKPKDIWIQRFQTYFGHLKENGTLLLALPNRLGLKYFAGCQDENYDEYFLGIEGYQKNHRKPSFGKSEYLELIQKAGFEDIKIYYPHSDYLFADTIFSDERLPLPGEIKQNSYSYVKDRYVLFNESKAVNSLLREGVFDKFSNAFLFVCHKSGTSIDEEQVIYSKFSVERKPQFQIRTDIIRLANGEKVVRKYPMSIDAQEHVQKMQENYLKLKDQGKKKKIFLCPAKKRGDAVQFEWISGVSLQDILQNYLDAGDESKAENLIKEYIDRTQCLMEASPVNIDLIFSNIFVQEDNWYIIDYEWVFEQQIPPKWILYRTMFNLANQLREYPFTDMKKLLKISRIAEEEVALWEGGEVAFHRYLRGDAVLMQQIPALLGNAEIPFATAIGAVEKQAVRLMNQYEKDTKKILYHMDRLEKVDGRILVYGWACGMIKKGMYIPVHLTVFTQEGKPIWNPVERIERLDVSNMLKTSEEFQYWGFQISWNAQMEQKYILRMNVGKKQKEIVLEV